MDDFKLRIDFQFSSSEKFRFVSSHHCRCSFECFIQFKLSGRWRQGGQNRWKGFWWNVLFYAADAAAGTLEHLAQLKKDLTTSQHSWHQLVNEHLVHCPFWSRAFIGGAVFASLIITTTRTFSQVTSLGFTMSPLKSFCSTPKKWPFETEQPPLFRRRRSAAYWSVTSLHSAQLNWNINHISYLCNWWDIWPKSKIS